MAGKSSTVANPFESLGISAEQGMVMLQAMLAAQKAAEPQAPEKPAAPKAATELTFDESTPLNALMASAFRTSQRDTGFVSFSLNWTVKPWGKSGRAQLREWCAEDGIEVPADDKDFDRFLADECPFVGVGWGKVKGVWNCFPKGVSANGKVERVMPKVARA